VNRQPDIDPELWSAVADPSRRQLLDVMLSSGEATPTALAGQLPFTRQAVTKHLAVLDRAGVVQSQRQGREVRYSVRPERLNDAVRAMAATAAQWKTRLKAIQRLAEQAHRAANQDPSPPA
jgi:DNA-binding transcriptional ArsR family regulator